MEFREMASSRPTPLDFHRYISPPLFPLRGAVERELIRQLICGRVLTIAYCFVGP